jgi:hypothetical protein
MVGVEEKREEELLTEQMVRELLMMGVMICLMMEFGVYSELTRRLSGNILSNGPDSSVLQQSATCP